MILLCNIFSDDRSRKIHKAINKKFCDKKSNTKTKNAFIKLGNRTNHFNVQRFKNVNDAKYEIHYLY